MAMSFDALLTDFNGLCSKAEGRDKLARFFQYLFRAYAGFSALAQPAAGSVFARAEGHARLLMVQLSGARRTFRWCKELPVLQSIPKSLQTADPIDRFLDVTQKVSLVAFFLLDHLGQLKQWKLISGGKRAGSGTIQLGLKYFCLSNFLGAILQIKKLLASKKDEKPGQRQKTVEALVRNVLLILQTAHMSLLYQTHDSIVGLAGVITSLMDVRGQWPERKKALA